MLSIQKDIVVSFKADRWLLSKYYGRDWGPSLSGFNIIYPRTELVREQSSKFLGNPNLNRDRIPGPASIGMHGFMR